MEYDEYYATPKEAAGMARFHELSLVHHISVAMKSGVFSEDYSGKYYLI